jgi:hypothetical protein
MNENTTDFYIEIKNEIILYAKKITVTLGELTKDDMSLSSEATKSSLQYYANKAYRELCHIEQAANLGVLDITKNNNPIEVIELANILKIKIKEIESISDRRFARSARFCVGNDDHKVCESVGVPFILALSIARMEEYQKLIFSIINHENIYLPKVFRQ